MYVYIRSETSLWTVGFYAPDGSWNPESDWSVKEAAAERVAYLNGGGNATTNYVNTQFAGAREHRFE